MSNINKYNHYGLFDPFFDDFFDHTSSRNELMRTDITDEGDHYLLKTEVPSIKKENIKLSLEEGYLTINVSYRENNDEKAHGKFLRRERHYGEASRSFYIGENVREEDIHASLNDGILTLEIAKPEKKEPEKKYIEIK